MKMLEGKQMVVPGNNIIRFDLQGTSKEFVVIRIRKQEEGDRFIFSFWGDLVFCSRCEYQVPFQILFGNDPRRSVVLSATFLV